MSIRTTLPPSVLGVFAVLRLLPRVSPSRTSWLATGTVVLSILPLAFTVLTGVLVGAIAPAIQHGLDSPAGHHAEFLLIAASATILAQRVLSSFVAAAATVFGRTVDLHLQRRVMAAVGAPSGIAHLEDPSTLNLIKTAQGVGSQGARPGDAVSSLVNLIPRWTQSLGSAAILLFFQWWIGLMWLLLWPVVLIALQHEYIRVGQVAGGHADAVRRADYYRDLALLPAAGKEVRILGLTSWIQDRFNAAWQRSMQPIWRARNPVRPVIWISTIAVAAASTATFGLLAHNAIDGTLTLAGLALFTRATIDAGSFAAFDDVNTKLVYAAVAVPSLLTLETRLPRTDVGRMMLSTDAPAECIRLHDVRFRYPGRDRDTLAGIDLNIPAGTSLAIVGLNGAGKTTLVKLLCALYTPTTGAITVDGEDLSRLSAQDWQRHIAAIFQDFTRYHLSARDNIALGATHIEADEEALRAVAEPAGAMEVVAQLTHWWDTTLSRQYTDGAELSGGQWQRVALARALFAVRGGARLLILDEPTANLDVRAESELYDHFLDITRGLTTVLISHRFSTVRRADHIVVLEDGRIAEGGNHADLMAHGGRYAEMFRLQAQRFTPGEQIPESEYA